MQLVFQSRAMLKVLEQARRFARTGATVLICGESGVGKELVARMLHTESPRSLEPYCRVNCAALAESLIESELFGHEAGAFTGALTRRTGKFEAAARGSLFLDEISEVAPTVQGKLLRVLEEAEFERVGGNDLLPMQARVIAATNRSLAELVDGGEFRADLFYRLDVLRLEIPALRDRKDDIPILAQHFVERFRGDSLHGVRGFKPAAIRRLADYHWPGNVRQLRNVVHRACVVAEQDLIDEADLKSLETHVADEHPVSLPFDSMSLAEIERQVILQRLEHCRGNKTAAAAALGVTAKTLRNKITEYRRLGYAS
ncbi:Transcriptional regulatory protein ZraR [Caulifigura coniformis]|uniref:Transcriptional regulatory protein ZraR n=1 Tax=Caulifigura coniformis TaxID=2527983 RepID=A0A517SCE6_9PLAN|nr:sigma-54 dependent transcriptional regulator [Caulifigura coniformis]QDT53802.1 Transcriptional regulatory protein ZraR [Caulifigura coniformis]